MTNFYRAVLALGVSSNQSNRQAKLDLQKMKNLTIFFETLPIKEHVNAFLKAVKSLSK